ncbi:hypothetical protein KSP40_PGU004692 [Platanthera guangdongensis]|uniref:Uncharacterized protein n=1 Tax=Platanthera guangdongensis TaxID=2320717 RepID=A0ABR2LJ73_9ASPA
MASVAVDNAGSESGGKNIGWLVTSEGREWQGGDIAPPVVVVGAKEKDRGSPSMVSECEDGASARSTKQTRKEVVPRTNSMIGQSGLRDAPHRSSPLWCWITGWSLTRRTKVTESDSCHYRYIGSTWTWLWGNCNQSSNLRDAAGSEDVGVGSLLQLLDREEGDPNAAGNTALAISRRCSASLRSLDLSFCREMTDEALGLIVDSCSNLRILKLFGCTQVTNVFLEGHSNSIVKVIGLKGSILDEIGVPVFN